MMHTPFTPERRSAAVLRVVEHAEDLLHVGTRQQRGGAARGELDDETGQPTRRTSARCCPRSRRRPRRTIVPVSGMAGEDVAPLDVSAIVEAHLLLQQRVRASFTVAVPFSSSSPTLRSPTVGAARPRYRARRCCRARRSCTSFTRGAVDVGARVEHDHRQVGRRERRSYCGARATPSCSPSTMVPRRGWRRYCRPR
jgi:hypothetical protein